MNERGRERERERENQLDSRCMNKSSIRVLGVGGNPGPRRTTERQRERLRKRVV